MGKLDEGSQKVPLLVRRQISTGDTMYNTMTIVNAAGWYI